LFGTIARFDTIALFY